MDAFDRLGDIVKLLADEELTFIDDEDTPPKAAKYDRRHDFPNNYETKLISHQIPTVSPIKQTS